MFQKDFFIARLHGRAEMPQTMALAVDDYTALRGESDYLDFLLEIFRSRSCLFVGFSFVDPAIDLVLQIYASKHGPNFNALHTALIPAGAADLEARLRAVNIEVVAYDHADHHADLWRAIRLAHQNRADKLKTVGSTALQSPGLRQFIAFAYAQVHVTREQRRGIAGIINDGLVLSILAKEPDKARTIADVSPELATVLRVSDEEAKQALVASIDRLAAREQVIRDGEEVLLLKPPPQVLNEHLTMLAESVSERVRVREGLKLLSTDLDGIRDVLEGILIARAWDLSAHYAGATAGIGADIRQAVRYFVAEQLQAKRLSVADPVERAIVDLLRFPEDREAKLLTHLGRAAFGLQLVLATPRQVLFQRFALPQRVYLDTNVLMPAITDGHPLQAVYVESLRRLDEAARTVDVKMEVVIGEQFLNEIVAHRRIASDIVTALDLNDPAKLRQHVSFRTATNANVFIAGFAANQTGKLMFNEYLRQVAPYETEAELAEYLQKRLGISARKMVFTTEHGGRFGEIFSDLLSGYESARGYDPLLGKEKILVQHEAQQLTQLRIDLDDGLRSVFVTADERLRRLLHRIEKLHVFAGMVISHVGLVALVDVMVGLEADTRSWARLMWATPQGSDEEALIEYFIRIGLTRYREGMAAEMQEAARRVAAKAAADAKTQDIALFGDRTMEETKATVRFLDRYEDEFFKNWKAAIEHRERIGG
jgi:hypothetical protein